MQQKEGEILVSPSTLFKIFIIFHNPSVEHYIP
jgi:hypothetical protein